MWETVELGARGFDDPLSGKIEHIRRSRGVAQLQLPDLVEQSWKRCLTDYNLLPDAVPRASVLSHTEIQLMMQEREEFLRIAEPEVERLFRHLVDAEYLVSLASPQGAMVLFRCDYQYLGELAGSGVIPGSVWSEDQQGTNGVGTCLRLGKPVTIAGSEHYGSAIQRLTCLTAPVLGRNGAIESVINVTTARHADSRVNRMVQNIVERSARRIENGYFGRLNRRNMMLRILDNGEIADIAEEGRLALDENGRILDGSSYAAKLLGQPVDQFVGRSAEDIFEIDQALADIRPDSPITMNYRGRNFLAVLSLPETRQRTARSLVVTRGAEPVMRTVDLAEETLRINPILSQAMDRARRLLSAGLPLVVTGETGSGKTAFAKTVARCSFGDDSEIVIIDCASLEAQLDLGAFLQRRLTAQKCCLVIDRIDEMDVAHQTALLALLENDRQAGANGIGVIVISTLDLDQLVRDNRMRVDLMRRLKGGQVALAPLRAAPDLEAAILHLFSMECVSLGKPDLELDQDSRLVLTHYHWPGNLRELRNTLRHAAALADGKLVGLEHLPDDVVDEMSRKDLTARYLGVSRATLYRKIQIQKARGEA